MKDKIIKPKDQKKENILSSIILLIFGIVLVTNSNQIVTIAFQVIGIFIVLYGVYKLFQYLNLKKKFKTEDSELLTKAIIIIAVGILLIMLASILEVGLRIILGLYLIINGLMKISLANHFNLVKDIFIKNIIEGIIFIILGLYTILVANAAFIIIGIILILSSIIDIIAYLRK